jgi:pyruvate kinase
MIHNPRPTRAETSDVANAVYDGTSAIMLSGETAAGAHPVEACRCMAMIAERTEQDIDYHKRFLTREYMEEDTITNAVARAAVTIAYNLSCQAILTMSESGRTARHISKFRPASPIIVSTPSLKTYYQLALIWGVSPLMIPACQDTDELTAASTSAAVEANLLRQGDITVITAGIPLGQTGSTNLLKVYVVGEP